MKAQDDLNGPAPWPYSHASAAAIKKHFPQERAEACFEDVKQAAGTFAVNMKNYQAPNPHDEVSRIAGAMYILIEELSEASAETLLHFHRCGAAFGPDELRQALDRFEGENQAAFDHLPRQKKRGGVANRHEIQLLTQIRGCWKFAHDGVDKGRGYPAFRRACVDPLTRFGFKRGRTDGALAKIEQLSRQS